MGTYDYLDGTQLRRKSSPFGPTAQDIISNPSPTPAAAPQNLNQAYFRPSNGNLVPGSSAEAALRAFANGVTANLAGSDVAALHATFPALSSGSSNAANWADRYQENQQIQNAQSAADKSAHPAATAVGSDLSWAAGLLDPEATVWQAMGKGARDGAIDGLGDALSKKETVDDGTNSVVGGAIKGAIDGPFRYWLRGHL